MKGFRPAAVVVILLLSVAILAWRTTQGGDEAELPAPPAPSPGVEDSAAPHAETTSRSSAPAAARAETRCTVRGLLLRPDGSPETLTFEVQLLERDARNGGGWAIRASSSTSAAGEFKLTAAPGKYTVKANNLPHDPVEVTFTQSGESTDLVIRHGGWRSLLVRVVEETGEVVPGMPISCYPDGSRAVTEVSGTAVVEVVAEQTFVGLDPEALLTRAFHRTPSVPADIGQREVTITLRKGRLLTGRLIPPEGASQLRLGDTKFAGACLVDVVGTDGWRGWTSPEVGGAFQVVVPDRGPFVVSAGLSSTWKVKARDGRERLAEARLTGVVPDAGIAVLQGAWQDLSRSLRVQVLDSTGGRVAGASVTCNDSGNPENRMFLMSKTDEQGELVLESLSRYPVSIRVDADDQVHLPAELADIPPDQAAITVSLRRGVLARVRVLDGAGSPAANVQVFTQKNRPPAMTDAGGRCELLVDPHPGTVLWARKFAPGSVETPGVPFDPLAAEIELQFAE